MEYMVLLADLGWVESTDGLDTVAVYRPANEDEVKAIVQFYYSSPEVFDMKVEKERTEDVVKMFKIKLRNPDNILGAMLDQKIWHNMEVL
jgi:hypothetical protein